MFDDRLQEKELAAKLAWNVLDLGQRAGISAHPLLMPHQRLLASFTRCDSGLSPIRCSPLLDRLLAADASLDESPTGPGDRNRIEPLSQRELDVWRMRGQRSLCPTNASRAPWVYPLRPLNGICETYIGSWVCLECDEAVTRARDLLLII